MWDGGKCGPSQRAPKATMGCMPLLVSVRAVSVRMRVCTVVACVCFLSPTLRFKRRGSYVVLCFNANFLLNTGKQAWNPNG